MAYPKKTKQKSPSFHFISFLKFKPPLHISFFCFFSCLLNYFIHFYLIAFIFRFIHFISFYFIQGVEKKKKKKKSTAVVSLIHFLH